MTSLLTQMASDLNEEVDNRYALVLEIAELAKKLLNDEREQRVHDPFSVDVGLSSEKVISQALMMKAHEIDLGDGLVG